MPLASYQNLGALEWEAVRGHKVFAQLFVGQGKGKCLEFARVRAEVSRCLRQHSRATVVLKMCYSATPLAFDTGLSATVLRHLLLPWV